MTVSGALADLYVLLRLKDEMSGPLDSSGRSVGTWKQKLTDGGLAASELAQSMVGPIDQAKEFDSVTARAALSTGLSETAVRALTSALWTADTPLTEAAGTIERLGREGMTSEAGILATASAFDTLADGLDMPTDAITDQLIPAFNAFGISMDEVPGKVDMLASVFHESGVDIEDFSGAMKKIGPTASGFGLTMEDIGASLIVMKDAGYDGRKMFSVLTSAISETSDANKDGKISTEELAAAIGVQGSALTTAEGKISSATGTADKWAEATNRGVSATAGAEVGLAKLTTGFGGLLDPISGVIGGLANLGPAILGVAGLDTLLGGSIASALSGATGTITGAAASVGSAITGGISSGLSGLGGTLSTIGGSAAGSMAAGLAGGLALGLAGVYVLVKSGALDAVKAAGDTFRSGNPTIAAAAQVLFAPLGMVGAAAIDIVTGEWERIPEDVGRIAGQAGAAWGPLTSGLATAFSDAGTWVSQGLSGIGTTIASYAFAFPPIGAPDISGVAASFAGLGGSISGALSTAGGAITGWFGGLWNTITGEASTYLSSGMQAAGVSLINALVQGIVGGIEILRQAVGTIAGIIGGFFPHSPAEEGPLREMPNWSAYVVDPLTEAGSQAKGAASAVAGEIASAAPGVGTGAAAGGGGGGDTWNVTVNATLSQDYTAGDMLDDIAAKNRGDRIARGYRSTV